MKILQQLCSVPTAPFAEHHVVRYVERFVRERLRLKLSRDRYGNLLIDLPAGRSEAPRTVVTAHMDHPGFVAVHHPRARLRPPGGLLQARFHGWVLPRYFRDEKVRFFNGDGSEVAGVVLGYTLGADRRVPETVMVRVMGGVERGAPGMWDQGEGRVKGKKF